MGLSEDGLVKPPALTHLACDYEQQIECRAARARQAAAGQECRQCVSYEQHIECRAARAQSNGADRDGGGEETGNSQSV